MKRRILMCLPFLLLLVGLVGSVSAACVVLNGTTILKGGSVVINATCEDLDNPVNCSISASSSESGGSFSVWLYNTTTHMNATYNTLTEADADDWSFTGTCYNKTTATEAVTTATGKTIDNTVPVITGCTVSEVTATNATVGESTATVACTVRNASACTLFWKGAERPMPGQYEDASGSYAGTSSFSSAGTAVTSTIHGIGAAYQNWYFNCTDSTNHSVSPLYKLMTEGEFGKGAAKQTAAQATQAQQIQVVGSQITAMFANRNIKMLILMAIGAVIIVTVIVIALSQTTKRRR